MSSITREHIFDDFTDEDITDNYQVVNFSIEGKDYTLDLSKENAAEVLETLNGFASKGTRVNEPGKRKYSPEFIRAARQFARDNGEKVGDRGRLQKRHLKAWEDHLAKKN